MSSFILKPLTLVSYRLTMRKLRTTLSDSYLTLKDIRILGCFTATFSPVGFALYYLSERICHIHHIEAEDSSFPVVDALVQAIKEQALACGVLSICWETVYPKAPTGFSLERSDALYRVDRSFLPVWEKFKAKTEAASKRFAHRGFETIPLNACTLEQIEQIKNIYREINNGPYLESVLTGELGTLLTEISAVTLANSCVIAFLIYSETAGHGCMLRYRASSRAYRHTGVMILPFIQSIENFIVSDYKALRFTAQTTNIDTLHLMLRHLPDIKPRELIHVYNCKLRDVE